MGRKVKICVADDESVIAEVLCEGLRAHNFEAVGANCGQDALDICRLGGVDLILLDINMPGIDGYEVCRRLPAASVLYHRERPPPACLEDSRNYRRVRRVTFLRTFRDIRLAGLL